MWLLGLLLAAAKLSRKLLVGRLMEQKSVSDTWAVEATAAGLGDN
jgi:hypothetical protein